MPHKLYLEYRKNAGQGIGHIINPTSMPYTKFQGVKVKVKQSLYRHGQALKFPGV